MRTPDRLPPYWVNRLGFAARKELTTRFEDNGLAATAEDWASLRFLAGGPQPTTALSAATLRDRTTVSRLADKLVGKGWVQRTPDAKDRRRLNLELTGEGRAALTQMSALADQLIAQVSVGISADEQRVAASVLQRMFENLSDASLKGNDDV